MCELTSLSTICALACMCTYMCVHLLACACVCISAAPAGSALTERFLVVASVGSVSVLFLFQTSFSRGFTKNMKLEAVNPRNPGELCVASVIAVKGRLMWLRLEGTRSPDGSESGVPRERAGANGCSTAQCACFTFLVFQLS